MLEGHGGSSHVFENNDPTGEPTLEFSRRLLSERQKAEAKLVPLAAVVIRPPRMWAWILAGGLAMGASVGYLVPRLSYRLAAQCIPACPSGQTCYKGACVKAAASQAQASTCPQSIEQIILEFRR